MDKKKIYSALTVLLCFIFTPYLFAGGDGGVFRYDAKGKRDPFVPLLAGGGRYATAVYGINNIKDISLEGIVWDGQSESIAIINGEIVREGDQLGEVRVVRIERDGVVFEFNGEEVKIKLNEE